MNNDLFRINYKELQKKLQDITNTEHRVLLKTTYAALGRIGEIVKPRYETYQGQGIMPKDINYTDTTLTLFLITEKRNTPRKIPIARIDNNEHVFAKKNESWITEDIIEYIKGRDKDQRIFNFSTRKAQKIFQKYFWEFNQHIHLLRKWRTTHLLNGQALGAMVPMGIVAKMGGWKDTKVLSSTYDGTIIEDYWKF